MSAKPGLGAVQRQALIRLYGSPDGAPGKAGAT
jgi:hypothetical protein